MHMADFPKIQARQFRRAAAMAVLAGAAVLAGCANQSASSSVYTYGQAQREQIVRLGTVESVRPITIQSDKSSGVGTVAGGALGGVAGSTVGGGTGQVLASIGGAIIGGLLGNAAENQMNRKSGLEITVRLDNGETRVIAQEADVAISAGQRVRLISGNGPTRVVPF
ncbi:outer membrane lipoprotein SlyB [Paracandidimonas soli]|uniref:Outer membrane lipoprotein SlyB n=2 Tax=Paracandidimonas soli TaxID=1917182 RepID=A0A4R3V7Y6_9BURK|nr:glycine zipper 2TM domain-containing protein [Paracandidimonas soli]TCU98514.1 outer membrane lipoprotein SlyB [Paracandidimonas soli]